MDDEPSVAAMAPGESWLVPRPAVLLQDLPVACQWEVTRRHPNYLRFWELAHRSHQQPSGDLAQGELEKSAVLVLLAIGVSGDPPPPGASAASLGRGGLSPAWDRGAIAPLTFRGLVGLLLASLSPEALVQVGQFLLTAGQPAENGQQHTYQALLELQRLPHPALNTLPNRPVFGVNVNAPSRVILEAVEQQVRQWKQQQDVPERRRRDDKLDEYLLVWDLREGWAEDHYDGSREQTLRQIATQQGIPLSTVANRYRSAFRLIVGREYAPALWARVMAPVKLHPWLVPEALPRRTLSRPWRDRQPRLVPAAVLHPPGDSAGANPVLNTAGISQNEIACAELVWDIQSLIACGRSDAAILAELELSAASQEMISSLRARQHDTL